MKYSIKGQLDTTDEQMVINLFNQYTLWRLVARVGKDLENKTFYSFEVWVNTEEDKTALFNELKPLVDEYGESISWHECTHDEEIPQSCVIVEEYRK